MCIDAGHGGFDCGAIGYDGTYEKEINLSIAKQLKELFEKVSIGVIMTRDEDKSLSTTKKGDLDARINMINNSDCSLFISIHSNTYPSEALYGAQTFFYNESDSALAKVIQDYFVLTTNTKRFSKKLENIYLLERVNKRGCLVEVGFISNEHELALLKDYSYQYTVANAICMGVVDYLSR